MTLELIHAISPFEALSSQLSTSSVCIAFCQLHTTAPALMCLYLSANNCIWSTPSSTFPLSPHHTFLSSPFFSPSCNTRIFSCCLHESASTDFYNLLIAICTQPLPGQANTAFWYHFLCSFTICLDFCSFFPCPPPVPLFTTPNFAWLLSHIAASISYASRKLYCIWGVLQVRLRMAQWSFAQNLQALVLPRKGISLPDNSALRFHSWGREMQNERQRSPITCLLQQGCGHLLHATEHMVLIIWPKCFYQPWGSWLGKPWWSSIYQGIYNGQLIWSCSCKDDSFMERG